MKRALLCLIIVVAGLVVAPFAGRTKPAAASSWACAIDVDYPYYGNKGPWWPSDPYQFNWYGCSTFWVNHVYDQPHGCVIPPQFIDLKLWRIDKYSGYYRAYWHSPPAASSWSLPWAPANLYGEWQHAVPYIMKRG